MRKVLLRALLPFLAACAGSSAAMDDAGDALREGRYEEAYRRYGSVLDRSPGDPLVQQKAELARSAVLKSRFDAARAAEKGGDLDGALRELRAASLYDPGGGTVPFEIERIEERRAAVEQDLARARSLVASGESREAAEILSMLGRYAPTFPEIRDLTRRTSRLDTASRARIRQATVARILAQARSALSRGDPGEAIAALDRGRETLGNDRELASGGAPIRAQVSKRLLDLAGNHYRAGRPAVALLFARAAVHANPAGDEARRRAATFEGDVRRQHAIEVRVATFADATGGRVDPATFTRHLTSVLNASAPCPWLTFTTDDRRTDLVASGKVTFLDVAPAPTRREMKVHQRARGIEQRVNPEYTRLQAEVADLADRLEEAEDRLEEIERELFYLERLEAQITVLRSGRRRFGDYNEARYYRILNYTRSRRAEARRDRASYDGALTRTRERLDGTPLYLERKLVDRVPYEESTIGKIAEARATYQVEAGPDLGSYPTRAGSVEAKETASDRVTRGLPEVGLAADPAELPSDPGIARAALRALARSLADEIGRKAAGVRLGLIPDARGRERSGDREGALDLYAAFALSAGKLFPLEQANAAMRLREEYGIDVSEGSLDLRGLKLR